MRGWLSIAGKLLAGWGLLLLVAWAFVWAAVTLAGQAILAADRWALTLLHELSVPWLITLSRAVTDLGKPSAMVPLTVFAVLAFAGLRQRRAALWVALSSIGVGSAYLILLPIFGRARPQLFEEVSGLSLPSGHVIAALSLALPSAVAAWRRWGRRSWPVAAVGTVLVLVISVTRVYIQFHWATDVLLAWAMCAAWVWWVDRTLPRADHDRPAATSSRPPSSSG